MGAASAREQSAMGLGPPRPGGRAPTCVIRLGGTLRPRASSTQVAPLRPRHARLWRSRPVVPRAAIDADAGGLAQFALARGRYRARPPARRRYRDRAARRARDDPAAP